MDENRSPQIPRKKRKIGVLLDVSKGRTHNKQVDVHPTRGEIDFSDAHLFENFFEWRTFSAIGTEIEIAEETSNCHGNNDKYYDDSIGEVGDCDDKTAEEEREKDKYQPKDKDNNEGSSSEDEEISSILSPISSKRIRRDVSPKSISDPHSPPRQRSSCFSPLETLNQKDIISNFLKNQNIQNGAEFCR